jgi:hypothetical protein
MNADVTPMNADEIHEIVSAPIRDAVPTQRRQAPSAPEDDRRSSA